MVAKGMVERGTSVRPAGRSAWGDGRSAALPAEEGGTAEEMGGQAAYGAGRLRGGGGGNTAGAGGRTVDGRESPISGPTDLGVPGPGPRMREQVPSGGAAPEAQAREAAACGC